MTWATRRGVVTGAAVVLSLLALFISHWLSVAVFVGGVALDALARWSLAGRFSDAPEDERARRFLVGKDLHSAAVLAALVAILLWMFWLPHHGGPKPPWEAVLVALGVATATFSGSGLAWMRLRMAELQLGAGSQEERTDTVRNLALAVSSAAAMIAMGMYVVSKI